MHVCALQRGCVRAVCAALIKLGDFLIKFGWHSHCQPVCLRDVFASSRGNVMHSAFPAFPSSPCECSAKVQLIQSLVDDSRHSVPFCTDTRTRGSANTCTMVPGWMRMVRSVLRQPLSALVKWSLVPHLHYPLCLCFYQPMHRHALSFTIFLSAFLTSWCLSLTPTQTFPVSWMYSRET